MKHDGFQHVSEIIPTVLHEMGLHDLARALSLKALKGGLRKMEKHEDANAGMVITDLETVPDEAA